MTLLSRAGYESVPLKIAATGSDHAAWPARPVVITFDDGTLDFWEHALPVLERVGFTATLFVVTGYVGGRSSWDRDLGEPDRPLMSWDQIRRLHGQGFEFGSHTHNHRPLTELSEEQARQELTRSRQALEDRLGVAPQFLAYPRGLYDDRHKRLARETGYAGACSVILHWRDLWRSERYELKRMTIKGTESMLGFRLRLWLCRFVRQSASE